MTLTSSLRNRLKRLEAQVAITAEDAAPSRAEQMRQRRAARLALDPSGQRRLMDERDALRIASLTEPDAPAGSVEAIAQLMRRRAGKRLLAEREQGRIPPERRRLAVAPATEPRANEGPQAADA